MTDIAATTALDTVLGFAIPERHARGRLARLGAVLDDVLAAHAYPPAIEKLVAEALVLATMLGAMLKGEESQLTLQAQSARGVVSLLVADYKAGAVRAYAQYDAERLAGLGETPTLPALFGGGNLAITFDQAVTGERYQGIVPLEGDGLGAAAEHYFTQSEQIPSHVHIAVRRDAARGCIGAGLLIQHLPEGEAGQERLHVRQDHPDWEHVATLARTVTDGELTDPALPFADLLWRLFHEEHEPRMFSPVALSKGCRCDATHIRGVLGRFPAEDRSEMADEAGEIHVDCAFCSRRFSLALGDFAA